MLRWVDSMIQLVISAGRDFSVVGHQKIPQNIKYWYGSMISGRHHDLTDAILKFHVCCGRFLLFIITYVVYLCFITTPSVWWSLQWIDFLVQARNLTEKASSCFVDVDKLLGVHVDFGLNHSINILNPVIVCLIWVRSERPIAFKNCSFLGNSINKQNHPVLTPTPSPDPVR